MLFGAAQEYAPSAHPAVADPIPQESCEPKSYWVCAVATAYADFAGLDRLRASRPRIILSIVSAEVYGAPILPSGCAPGPRSITTPRSLSTGGISDCGMLAIVRHRFPANSAAAVLVVPSQERVIWSGHEPQ